MDGRMRSRQGAVSRYLFPCVIPLVFFTAHVEAETLTAARLDSKHNVHVITTQGLRRQITHDGRAMAPRLAPDKLTVGWLVTNPSLTIGHGKPGSEILAVYRNGKYTFIRCGPLVRQYRFWRNGSEVAIDCGGEHFAGREILYDTRTGKELARFDEADVPMDERPQWADVDASSSD